MSLNGYTLSHALSQALMALSLLGLSAASMAEKADRNKPMQIDADKVTYNEAKQQQVFTGNVILTKGTLVIKAQRVETRLDAQGYQQAIATGTAAQPASYAQKREGLDETIEAQALTLTFDGKADTVVLADQDRKSVV